MIVEHRQGQVLNNVQWAVLFFFHFHCHRYRLIVIPCNGINIQNYIEWWYVNLIFLKKHFQWLNFAILFYFFFYYYLLLPYGHYIILWHFYDFNDNDRFVWWNDLPNLHITIIIMDKIVLYLVCLYAKMIFVNPCKSSFLFLFLFFKFFFKSLTITTTIKINFSLSLPSFYYCIKFVDHKKYEN